MNQHHLNNVGGTSGGAGQFLFGLALVIAGGYLFTKQVTVSSGAWQVWGYSAFGLSLFPLLIGIGLLFFNGRSWAGRLLVFAGAVIILAGIIANLNVYFQPTSLFNTVMILGLLAAGIGLVARSLRAQ